MIRIFEVRRTHRFREYLEWLWPRSATFELTIRPGLGLSPELETLLDHLEPFLLESFDACEWPGTILVGHVAMRLRYRATGDALRHICGAQPARLFDWQQPASPEDLTMYRDDGSILLESVAHENEARVHVSAAEFSEMPETLQAGLTAFDP